MLQLILPGPGNVQIEVDHPDGFRFTADENRISTILSAIIPYVFAIAGIILFVMFLAAGFILLTATGNQEKMQQGSKMMTSALIGFIIIFLAYWIMQILQIIFGLELGFTG
jgi:uncharacterized membrane protein